MNRCAREGISKINIYSDFMDAGAKSVSEKSFTNYIDVLKASREGMKTTLKHYYHVFETK